jgi:hypothetical protein
LGLVQGCTDLANRLRVLVRTHPGLPDCAPLPFFIVVVRAGSGRFDRIIL